MSSFLFDETARVGIEAVFEKYRATDVFALLVSVGDSGLVDDIFL